MDQENMDQDNPVNRIVIMADNQVGVIADITGALAAAGIIVLLVILLSMNAVAIYFRNRYQARSED